MKRTLFVAVLFALAAIAGNAQAGVVTTTFSSNNSQSGNMFDVVTLGGPLTVNAFDLNLAQGSWNIEVYRKSGSWQGHESDPSAWTLIDAASVNSAGANVATYFDVADFTLDGTATSALYITSTVSNSPIMQYTNGSGVGNVAAANADLQILEGAGVSYAFSSLFTPRIWNGSIYYSATSVPEPGTLAILGAGLVGLALGRRRRV